MRTDELIRVLAADNTGARMGWYPMLSLAIVLGGGATALALVATIGVRPDIAEAAASWRFDLKLLLVATAFLAALVDCIRLSSPSESRAWHWTSKVVIVLLAGAVAFELAVTPPASWGSRLVGTNALLCIVAVPLLALAPLATMIWAMRQAAPRSPTLAGAACGRLAAALGAFAYAMHCFDDSPLFVAVWFTAAVGITSLLGFLVGRRLLAW